MSVAERSCTFCSLKMRWLFFFDIVEQWSKDSISTEASTTQWQKRWEVWHKTELVWPSQSFRLQHLTAQACIFSKTYLTNKQDSREHELLDDWSRSFAVWQNRHGPAIKAVSLWGSWFWLSVSHVVPCCTNSNFAGTRAVPADACQGQRFGLHCVTAVGSETIPSIAITCRTRTASCGSSCKGNWKVSIINELTLLMCSRHAFWRNIGDLEVATMATQLNQLSQLNRTKGSAMVWPEVPGADVSPSCLGLSRLLKDSDAQSWRAAGCPSGAHRQPLSQGPGDSAISTPAFRNRGSHSSNYGNDVIQYLALSCFILET